MVNCWADCLGGCSSKQSGEHYVTKGLFEGDSLKIKGLPWCKFEEKTIGLGSATANILCKAHNEQLSQLDGEAIRAFDAIREIFELQERQRALRPQVWKTRTWRLNGPLLERWFLKTTINLVHVQTHPATWPNATSERTPPRDVVETVFGLIPIARPRGLHAAAAVGQNVHSHDYVGFAPVNDLNTGYLAAGMFEFRGFRFVLSWSDRSLENYIRYLGEHAPPYQGWKDAALLQPFEGMKFTSPKGHLAQHLRIVWPKHQLERA
jgi:hypothetical protein